MSLCVLLSLCISFTRAHRHTLPSGTLAPSLQHHQMPKIRLSKVHKMSDIFNFSNMQRSMRRAASQLHIGIHRQGREVGSHQSSPRCSCGHLGCVRAGRHDGWRVSPAGYCVPPVVCLLLGCFFRRCRRC